MYTYNIKINQSMYIFLKQLKHIEAFEINEKLTNLT